MFANLPRISIIVPTCERVELLDKALHSIFLQKNKDIEIIIVYFSGFLEIKNLIEKHEKTTFIRLLHNPERNVSISRNMGCEYARGEYIAFLDDDDTWLDSKLSQQLDFMKQENSSVCFTGINILKGNTRTTVTPKYNGYLVPNKNTKKIYRYKELRGRYCLFLNNPYCTCTLIIKKSVFLEIKHKHSYFYDANLTYDEDIDLYIRLALNYRIDVLEIPLTNVFVHQKSITNSNNSICNPENSRQAFEKFNKRNKKYIKKSDIIILKYLRVTKIFYHTFRGVRIVKFGFRDLGVNQHDRRRFG